MNFKKLQIKPYIVQTLNSSKELEMLQALVIDRTSPLYAEFLGDFEFFDDMQGHDIDDFSSFIFTDDRSMRKYARLLELVGYHVRILDASQMLFEDNIDLSSAGDEMRDTVKEYIITHFTTDDVLDKMLKGSELTEIDHRILESVIL